MKKRRQEEPKNEPAAAGPRRMPYQPPKLIVWGTVRQLTAGANGGMEDFPPTFDGTQTV